MTLRADLLCPEAYGPPRPARIDLVETHISWVFLLERDVFKVKKPVDLGFLDFRSLEQRRRACEAEVRLNARLAPHVYKGVVPVHEVGGRASLHGEGPVVDYAVHMARLPDGCRADVLLERGELTGEAIDTIAARIAAFHEKLAAGAEAARYGTPEAIAHNVKENFAQTRDAIGKYLRPEEASEIVGWQTAFLRDGAQLFERRLSQGRVRDGHGDLRLEHVYLQASGAPVVIDCIEFSDRFRFADVCADIAFLSMDLAAHGRVDLAERLLARYARDSGDYDLYALVDFYEAYRAFVRGKVAAIVAADEQLDAGARERAAAQARRHFLLALSADRRSLVEPAVVVVGGVIASGKSTVAEHLGLEMSAPVIDADRTRKALLHVEPERRLDDPAWQGAYDPAVTVAVYAEVLRRAEVVLASGRPVVLDASFRSRGLRAAAHRLAEKGGLAFRFVECRADPSLCKARLAERASERGVSDGRLEIFDAFCARFEPVVELPAAEYTLIDTARPLADSLKTLRARLGTWPRGLVA